MIFLIAFGVLLGVVLVRTILFKPKQMVKVSTENTTLNEKKVVEHFSELIQLKTVSSINPDEMDMAVFKAFQNKLDELYPVVTKTCHKELIGPTGILYRWKGKDSQDVTVLMSHYDVVPADVTSWEKDPFSGSVEEGVIWGRGTIDTKVTLLGILESAEQMMTDGFIPEHDVYFSFTGDEEVSGPSTPEIVETFIKRGIKPYMVVDEGGVVLKDVFPGVHRQTALVGIGEKGYLDVEITGTSSGGHSSAPPSKALTGDMARLIINIEKKSMKSHLTPPVLEMFDRLGRHSTFLYRMIFGNIWLFSPLLKFMFRKQGGQMNALIRTTTAVTKLEGSNAFNVLPPKGTIGVNCRILNTDTVESTLSHLKSLAHPKFNYKKIEIREASPITPTGTKQWQLMEEVIGDMWPKAVLSPYLMIAATDSRHFNLISEHVMRFAPIAITKDELNMIHSNNERIRTETVIECIQFYIKLIKRL
ncbi:MAG: M20/M25/M40 family metallo-hydrolase [Clostridiales bacterium]|nr:M20/M25/M40 family metallo-hydrolase [Clostridiales bacterium]